MVRINSIKTTGLMIILFFILIACSEKNKQTKEQIIQKDPIAYEKDTAKLNAYRFLVRNISSLKHFKNGNLLADLNVVDQDFLMKNIDQSYAASKGLLESGLITISDFHEYVLPYRVNYGRIENWRDDVWKRIGRINLGCIKTEEELIDSCNSINNSLKKWFSYGNLPQNDDTLGFRELTFIKKSTCRGMANLAAYTLRSLGAPIAIDYAVWGNMNGGHIWNSLVTKDQKVMPFLGAESSIDSENKLYLFKVNKNNLERLSTFKKPGKVYRATFSIQKQSFSFRAGESYILPPELSEKRIKDVTKEYVSVTDIKIPLTISDRKSPGFLVLCAFNTGAWIPIMGTLLTNQNFVFSDVGKDMLYNTFSYSSKLISKPYGYPIYIDRYGVKKLLKPNDKKLIDIELSRTQSIVSDQLALINKKWNVDKLLRIAKGMDFKRPINGNLYKLYIWDEGWKVVCTSKADSQKIKFRSIPSNGLYIISVGENQKPEDRPFIIDNNKLKWL